VMQSSITFRPRMKQSQTVSWAEECTDSLSRTEQSEDAMIMLMSADLLAHVLCFVIRSDLDERAVRQPHAGIYYVKLLY
jgi:hypothetical protein